jgi:hypothetical protein
MEKISYDSTYSQRGSSNALYDDISGIIGKYKTDPSQVREIG